MVEKEMKNKYWVQEMPVIEWFTEAENQNVTRFA